MSGPAHAATVEGIQRHLEAIYAIDTPHRARDFLIGDQVLQRLVDAGVVAAELQGGPEHLLVLDGQDGVEVALYLADGVGERLAAEANLQDHCHATEAVSHFLMLMWLASQGRSARRLDLEIQAEVDKATTCLLLDRGTTGGAGAKALLSRLFVGPRFLPSLSLPERARYLEAHRLGSRYAEFLLGLLDEGVDRLLAELRQFYRLPLEGKREHAILRAA